MLTGPRAFAGETVVGHDRRDSRARAGLDALPPTTPAAVRRLLQRCLEKDPKRRLRDIGDARIEIDDAIAGRPEAPAAGERRYRWRTDANRPWIAAAAVISWSPAFTLWFLWRGYGRPIDRPLLRLVGRFGPSRWIGRHRGTDRSSCLLTERGSRLVARDSDGHPRLRVRGFCRSQILTFLGGDRECRGTRSSRPTASGSASLRAVQMKEDPVARRHAGLLVRGSRQCPAGLTWGRRRRDNPFAEPLQRAPPAPVLPADHSQDDSKGALVNAPLAANPPRRPGGLLSFHLPLASGLRGTSRSFRSGRARLIVVARGFVSGRYLPSGHLVFIRGAHVVWSVHSISGAWSASGVPVPLQDDVELLR